MASTSSSCPLPATPAMPRISPSRTSKLTPLTVCRPRSLRHGQVAAPASIDLARVALAAIDGQLDLAADHQLGELVLVRLAGDAAAHHLAAPDDRDAVGDLEDLVELVADEDDAVALGRQAAQDREDLDGLLRRQDGGGLVEDEDAGVPIERLEDLDALLPADRELADLLVGIELEPEPLAELTDALGAPRRGPGRAGRASSPRRGGRCRPRSAPAPA